MKTHALVLEAIGTRHLLKHPFYQAWMKGELSRERLRHYAIQYYPHVSAFPRFVSAIHSLCENEEARKTLFGNLSEEEGGDGSVPHPELWLRFAEGLKASRDEVHKSVTGQKALALVSLYFKLCRASYAEGLGALIAYEMQVPEIAKAKIDGLKNLYGVNDDRTLAFFVAHEQADHWHSESCLELVEKLSEKEQALAMKAASAASQALWDFLSEVHSALIPEAA